MGALRGGTHHGKTSLTPALRVHWWQLQVQSPFLKATGQSWCMASSTPTHQPDSPFHR